MMRVLVSGRGVRVHLHTWAAYRLWLFAKRLVARGNTIKSSHSDDSRPASSSHGRVGRGDL